MYLYIGTYNISVTFCYHRSDHWWNFVVLQTFTAQDWIENFRMSRETFTYVCERLSPTLRKEDTSMRRSISVEQSGHYSLVSGNTS